MRIVSFDQIDFPLTVPTLQLLLAHDRKLHVAEHLETDQTVDSVAAGETTGDALPVLVEPLDEAACHADIQRPARLAGEDVEAGLAINLHDGERVATWTLKQVQGDGLARGSHSTSGSATENRSRARGS